MFNKSKKEVRGSALTLIILCVTHIETQTEKNGGIRASIL